jgi:uncharacterized caspase-like protein
MKRHAVIFVTVVVLTGLFISIKPALGQESKYALVIGNGRYQGSPLRNPVNDANDMAKALSRIGFTVDKQINADRRQMREAVRRFADRIKRGGVGLFFYAGHGVQVDGENYLVPIGADIKAKYDVRDQCLSAQYVLGAMEDAGNRLNIIILDACRDNPFRGFRGGGRGLATMSAPVGSLLAYATAPGSTASDGPGSNGLYTSMLLRYLTDPGQDILDLFIKVRRDVMEASSGGQIPWETHSLTSRYQLVPGSGTPATASPPVTTPPTTVPATAPVRPAPTASVPASAPAPPAGDTADPSARRTWFGVQIMEINQEIAQYYKTGNRAGVMVAAVDINSPAFQAGLQAGDQIWSFGGKLVVKPADLTSATSAARPGDTVEVRYWRGNQKNSVNVTLAEKTNAEIKNTTFRSNRFFDDYFRKQKEAKARNQTPAPSRVSRPGSAMCFIESLSD